LLSLELVGLHLFGLFLEDGFNEDSPVLELVALGSEVKLVVEGAIDLLGLSVLPEEPPEYSLPADPQDFGGHPAFAGSPTFTCASVVAFALGLEVQSGSGAGVHFLFSLHDEAVLDEFAHEHSGVGLADLLHLVGVHPHALLSALQHLSCQSFLTFQTHHNL